MDMDLLAAKVSELAGFVWNGLPFTLSFYLRDSAGFPALHLRYSSELLQSHIHP